MQDGPISPSDYILKCLSIGTRKTINFPFVLTGNSMAIDIPIYKHITNRL